jgi:hypothetical protein
MIGLKLAMATVTVRVNAIPRALVAFEIASAHNASRLSPPPHQIPTMGLKLPQPHDHSTASRNCNGQKLCQLQRAALLRSTLFD